MIYDIDDIASYVVPHDSSNVLDRELLSMSIVKEVYLIGQESEGNTYQYFEMVKEGVNLSLYT